MRNLNLLCLLLISLTIFSCKKEKKESVTPDDKLHALNFKLPDFSQTKSPLDASMSDLKINAVTPPDSVPQIVYRIYDNTGKLIKTIIHLPDDPHYNDFTDSVPSGTYTVVFGAGYNLFKADGNKLSTDIFWYYDPAHDDLTTMGAVLWKDFFYQKFILTVGTQDITQNVELQRKLAKIQLNVEDAIPANVKKMDLSFSESNVVYNIGQDKFTTILNGGGHSNVVLDNRPAKNLVAGSTNNSIATLTANVSAPFTITISGYDASGNVVVQRKISITGQANKVTLISGKLFNTAATNSLVITPNTTWNPDKAPIQF